MAGISTTASAIDGESEVRVLRSSGDIPAPAWQDLAPADDPLWSQAFLAAMERSNIGPDAYRYLVLYQQGQVRAVLPAFIFHRLPLNDIVGEEGRRLLRYLRWLPDSLLHIRVLFCGHLLGEGRVLRTDDLPLQAPELLVDAARALAERHRTPWIVFKDFVRPDLDWLRTALERRGFFPAPGLPDAVLSLSAASFDDYLAALPAKARRNTRAKLRKFAGHPDTRLEVREEFSALIPQMMPLYQAVLDRAESRLDAWTPEFLRALSEDARIRTKLVACWHEDRLVAFLLCLFRGNGAMAARVGLDYRCSRELRVYHVAHYRGVEEAITAGCTAMNFAQTTYEPKSEMGCHLVPLDHAITHRNPFLRAILRRALPAALNQAGQGRRLLAYRPRRRLPAARGNGGAHAGQPGVPGPGINAMQGSEAMTGLPPEPTRQCDH